MLRTSRALIFKLFHIPKMETPPPPAVVFRIAVMDLLFMSLSCDDLFRSALQSEIPPCSSTLLFFLGEGDVLKEKNCCG